MAGYGISGGWLHAKLTLVLLLIVFHGLCWSHLRAFRDDRNTRSERYFRIINELPVFLLFGFLGTGGFFAQAKKGDEDLEAIGERMKARKEELMAKMGGAKVN